MRRTARHYLPAGWTVGKINFIFDEVQRELLEQTRSDEVSLHTVACHSDLRDWWIDLYGTFDGREFYKRIGGHIVDLSAGGAVEQFFHADWQQLMLQTISLFRKLDNE